MPAVAINDWEGAEMVGSVGAAGSGFTAMAMTGMGRMSQQPLSDDQVSQVQDILNQYDSGTLSATDAQSINQAFSEAGIQPGAGLRDVIEAAGFDAEQLRTLGAPEGTQGQQTKMPPPPPSGGGAGMGTGQQGTLSEDQIAQVQDILSNYDAQGLTRQDAIAINQSFSDAGITPSADLKQQIESAGFNSNMLRALDGPGGLIDVKA